MPTNPYQSPQEPNADRKVRSCRVRHDAKFWLWAIALATLVAPMGAALGIVLGIAVLIVVIVLALLLKISLPLALAPFDPWTVAAMGGILISELVVVKSVLERSNRIRAVNHRVALKSLNKSIP